jgi:hypothetical protein
VSTQVEDDWAAARERLREQADREWPDAWRPEPGDELLGAVAAVTPSAPTAFGPAPVVEVITPRGDLVSVWLFTTVLRRAFERENVQVGERIQGRGPERSSPTGQLRAVRRRPVPV